MTKYLLGDRTCESYWPKNWIQIVLWVEWCPFSVAAEEEGEEYCGYSTSTYRLTVPSLHCYLPYFVDSSKPVRYIVLIFSFYRCGNTDYSNYRVVSSICMSHFKVSYHPWNNPLSRWGYGSHSWSEEGKQLKTHLVLQLSWIIR